MKISWNKIFELRKGAIHPQRNSNFMSKIEEDLVLPTLPLPNTFFLV